MLMISLLDLEKNAQHAHAHALLRECLKQRRIAYSDDTPMRFGKLGKPYLAERQDVFFNLSHADGIAACIVADSECGIDCEKVRRWRPNVVKRSFSASEQALIESAPEDERALMFFRLWTLKEAYVKMLGIGVSYPLSEVSFGFEPERIVCSEPGCIFRQYIVKNEFIVSTCIKNSAAGLK